MDNLRWILILAGVGILVMLYLSGRRGGSSSSLSSMDSGRRSAETGDEHHDPLFGDATLDDPLSSFDHADPDDYARPGMADMEREARQRVPDNLTAPSDYELDEELVRSLDSSSGNTTFAQKIEAISERLSPLRRQRIAEVEPKDIEGMSPSDPEFANKIITLHILAPNNTLIDGEHLLSIFDSRGYHFGDMDIFHSMHEGKTVFSIAKIVEPGYFDINDVSSFNTPGITLILQLPGPVPADVSFNVLVSEADEIARQVGAVVLDGDRNTLSKQTLQHMREGVYEYMHRQKYFGSVPS